MSYVVIFSGSAAIIYCHEYDVADCDVGVVGKMAQGVGMVLKHHGIIPTLFFFHPYMHLFSIENLVTLVVLR